MTDHTLWDNPLTTRYASREMSALWSPHRKHSTWRRLWVALAEAEQELGLTKEDGKTPRITAAQLEQLRKHVDDIDFAKADAYEKRFRHDVMAHIHAYGDVLDITLYRDDLNQRRPWPVLRGTAVPFSIDDRRVVLVDDVLFSGRTAHAALAALGALGRPACVRLAVLIDRDHRQFPIQPDFVGQKVAALPGQRVYVRLQETDGIDEVVLS